MEKDWLVRIFRAYLHAYLWHLFVTPPVAATIFYIRGFQSTAAVWDMIQQRPIVAVGVVFAALGVSAVLLIACAYIYRKIVRFFDYGRIVRGCGIEHYFPRTEHKKTREWERFVELAGPKDADVPQFPKETDSIRILCITGAETFARPNAPLHALLERHHGNIEILIVASNSAAFQQRIHEMSRDGSSTPWGDAGELRKRFNVELEETRDFCLRLAHKAPAALRSIEVRAYEAPVNFKMAFVGRYLWFQHYEPYDDVELSSACVFRNRAGGWYSALDCAFLNRWKMSGESDSRILLRRTADNKWSGKWYADTSSSSGSYGIPDVVSLSAAASGQPSPPRPHS